MSVMPLSWNEIRHNAIRPAFASFVHWSRSPWPVPLAKAQMFTLISPRHETLHQTRNGFERSTPPRTHFLLRLSRHGGAFPADRFHRLCPVDGPPKPGGIAARPQV